MPLRNARMADLALDVLPRSGAVDGDGPRGTPESGLIVQACGDAHLSNFGLFASPERELVFDLNDFDETAPGPWEWDVKRLAGSLVVAARILGARAHDTRHAAIHAVKAYQEHVGEYAAMRAIDVVLRKGRCQHDHVRRGEGGAGLRRLDRRVRLAPRCAARPASPHRGRAGRPSPHRSTTRRSPSTTPSSKLPRSVPGSWLSTRRASRRIGVRCWTGTPSSMPP